MDPETAMFFGAITESLESILSRTEGMDADSLNWRPDVPAGNSLYALTLHTLSNVHRNILSHYCGEPYAYDRAAEFRESGTAAELAARHADLVVRMERALEAAGAGGLTRICDHQRLGKIPGRAVLLQAARHAAEHAGEANLTRALLDAQ